MARRAMARQRKGRQRKRDIPCQTSTSASCLQHQHLRSPPVWVTPSQHTRGALATHPTPMDGTAAQSEPVSESRNANGEKQPHTLTWRRTHVCISKSKVGLQVGRQATQALCGAGRLASPEMCSVGTYSDPSQPGAHDGHGTALATRCRAELEQAAGCSATTAEVAVRACSSMRQHGYKSKAGLQKAAQL